MTDIVERLREPIQYTEADVALRFEAAEEIERLRERCAGYKGQVESGAMEIERLRSNEQGTEGSKK